MWIRSPWWDGFWILSGLPLAAALTCATAFLSSATILLWCFVVIDTGHTLSPIVLAWSHSGFRQLMLQRLIKYAGLPLATLVLAALAGLVGGHALHGLHFDAQHFSFAAGPTTLGELGNPFMAMVAIYALWNAYHFGMQAFGVMSIYRRKTGGYATGQRGVDMAYCCCVIWATMLMPFIPRLAHGLHDVVGWPPAPHPFLDRVQPTYLAVALALIILMMWREWRAGRSLPRALFILTDGFGMIAAFWFGLWGFAIIALNHWLVAIGLVSHVHANHRRGSPTLFAAGLMAAGLMLFCVLFVDPRKAISVGLSAGMLSFTVTAVGFRLGLGFVHFLYDRWVYKLSNPQVRSTIGRDILFSARAVHHSSPFEAAAVE